VPLLVGFLQLANVAGVPGVAHFPYVGGAYEGHFFRLTSVARESSWFGSFACVTLPFLVIGVARTSSTWRRWGLLLVIGNLLLFVVLGTSKSAYAAVATEIGVGLFVVLAAYRPMRLIGKFFFGMLVLATMLFATAVAAPRAYDRVTEPFIIKAVVAYQIFAPLLEGNTKFVSIGTRLGMSTAGVSMGQDHPVAGVGLGQFGFNVYNYIPLWGLNPETLGWLSNDLTAWPSTSNLYTRLLAEVGALGMIAYMALRLVLLLAVARRLLWRDGETWLRDLAVFSAMTALIVFDFHRDSFVNLDLWAVLGMALACMHETAAARQEAAERTVLPWLSWRLVAATAAASFIVAMAVILSRPVGYQASTTLVPKSGGVSILPASDAVDSAPGVVAAGDTDENFKLLRMLWGSSTVAERMIAVRPDLVRAALKADGTVTPAALADYIKWNVAVLMADSQTTLTFRYRNADPDLAKAFLATAVGETDRAIAAISESRAAQAARLSRMVMARNTDIATRQMMLALSAAQELQSGFDQAGENNSFDYVEHPGVSLSALSPQPAIAVLFALVLAGLTAAIVAAAGLLWPAFFWRSFT